MVDKFFSSLHAYVCELCPPPTHCASVDGYQALFPSACLQVWAVPTTHMQCNWLGERVATVDVERAITNVRRCIFTIGASQSPHKNHDRL